MPTDLGQLHRRQAAVARLATMGAPAPAAGPPGPIPLQAVRRTAAPPVALPVGAAVRTADDKGRVKPGFPRPLSELLGWGEGDLACHMEGCWLVLTQPEGLRGRRRTRNSTNAHLSGTGTGSGAERLCLSPAQAHAALGADRQVFLVPVPGARALVICAPGAFLTGAPASVARLFEGSGAHGAPVLVPGPPWAGRAPRDATSTGTSPTTREAGS